MDKSIFQVKRNILLTLILIGTITMYCSSEKRHSPKFNYIMHLFQMYNRWTDAYPGDLKDLKQIALQVDASANFDQTLSEIENYATELTYFLADDYIYLYYLDTLVIMFPLQDVCGYNWLGWASNYSQSIYKMKNDGNFHIDTSTVFDKKLLSELNAIYGKHHNENFDRSKIFRSFVKYDSGLKELIFLCPDKSCATDTAYTTEIKEYLMNINDSMDFRFIKCPIFCKGEEGDFYPILENTSKIE